MSLLKTVSELFLKVFDQRSPVRHSNYPLFSELIHRDNCCKESHQGDLSENFWANFSTSSLHETALRFGIPKRTSLLEDCSSSLVEHAAYLMEQVSNTYT